MHDRLSHDEIQRLLNLPAKIAIIQHFLLLLQRYLSVFMQMTTIVFILICINVVIFLVYGNILVNNAADGDTLWLLAQL